MFRILLSEIHLGRQTFLRALFYGKEGTGFSDLYSNLCRAPWCGWGPFQPCLREGWFWHMNTADFYVTWLWFFFLLLFKLAQAGMASRFFARSWGSRKSHALVKVQAKLLSQRHWKIQWLRWDCLFLSRGTVKMQAGSTGQIDGTAL